MGKHGAGFTLIELMVVVAIVGLLGAFVYPVYSDSVKRANRSQIMVLLWQQSQSLERFFSKNGVYRGAENLSVGNKHYWVTHALGDHDFLLTATRREGASMVDDACGNFTLAHTGLMAITQAAPDLTEQQCWGN